MTLDLVMSLLIFLGQWLSDGFLSIVILMGASLGGILTTSRSVATGAGAGSAAVSGFSLLSSSSLSTVRSLT